jgi:hypothetical protein
MSNSEFLEEILFEGHKLGIIDPLMNEAKIEIDKGVHAHPCDAYLSALVRLIREMDIKESSFYSLSLVS